VARDESDALIRLADAVAGLTREAEEGHEDAMRLMCGGIRRSVFVQVQ